MKSIPWWEFVAAATFMVALNATSGECQTLLPKKDTQNWNDFFLSIPMSKKVDLVYLGTLRIGDNLTQPVDERWGIGWIITVNKYLILTPFYIHREARLPRGREEREERLTLGGILQKKLGKFTLSDRNWFERRWREPQVDAWRYRNRVRLEHPFKMGKRKFTWFVSDEVFYDWSLHDWVRNRAAAGVIHVFNNHVSGEFYFMRQNDGRARPGDINIIGTIWRFRR